MKLVKLVLPLLVLAMIFAGCGQKPGDLKLNTGSVNLKAQGASQQLTATVYDTKGNVIASPSEPISWSSNNPAVAKLEDGGKVVAVGTGTAVVTAATGGLSASATIKVQIIKSVTISPGHADMKIGDMIVFKATALDEKGKAVDAGLKWKIGNSSVATIANGKVKGMKGGKTFVTVSAGDKAAKASITVIDAKEGSEKIGGMKKGNDKKKDKKKVGGMKKK